MTFNTLSPRTRRGLRATIKITTTYIMIFAMVIIACRPFILQSLRSGRYVGIIDRQPQMVDPDHALPLDIRTNKVHENSLCTNEQCLLIDKHHDLSFSHTHSSQFLLIQNEDNTLTFLFDRLCLSEDKTSVILADCSTYNDKFIRKTLEPEDDVVAQRSYDQNDTDVVFNYGVEDTNHMRDTIIKMRKEDENYTLVPQNRHHNSHVHRVGGFADRAYYTYFSYHPSSRHSAYNFHNKHHGIPNSWQDESPSFTFGLGNFLN
ncbi:hypothetical protein COBT_001544 [Conglomerata obtusa]